MSALRSALYLGHVMHQRLRPRRHKFDYSGFWFVFDLDEIEALAKRVRFFSRNRFNLFSFFDRDYGDRSGAPPRAHVERHLASAGLAPDGGAIRLLTLPRVLGFVFNPLSVYFIHRGDGALRAILWEVSNTFGERHSYLIPVTDPEARAIRQTCAKRLHVSPFLDMDMTYHFRVAPPGERMLVSILAADKEGTMIATAMNGVREEITNRGLLSAFVSIPLMTLKVVIAIHFEALWLWLKGVGFRHGPQAPTTPVSYLPAGPLSPP